MVRFGPLAAVAAGGLLAHAPGAAAQTGDESALFSEIGRLNNQSLLWGPYRPNLYFGVRPRIPKSLVTGLMWGRADTYTELQNNVRYTCEQNEGMAGYGWEEYDTRLGGIQTIHDSGNNIDITTSFAKIPGGAHGGSWGARIKGVPREDEPDGVKTMVVLYVAQEEDGALLAVAADNENDDYDDTGFANDVTLVGSDAASGGLGDFKLVVTKGPVGAHPTSDHPYSAERDLEKTVVQSLTVPEEHIWQAKGVLFRQIKAAVDYVIGAYDPDAAPPPWQVYQLGNQPGRGNVQIVQKMFEGPFEFDVLFSSASAGHDLTSEDLTRALGQTSEAFEAHFAAAFPLQAPFAADAQYRRFAESLFANLLGGIGYFYGHGIVDRSFDPAYEETDEGFWQEAAEARARHRETLDGPYELFTSIPSRPFFPRGFLWDEGFHLLPIADWDLDLTLEVVQSWFNLMDDDGWIAREQILGPEARSKVPPEFQVQYPHYANPPTLFFVVDQFVEQLRRAGNDTDETGRRAAHRAQDGGAYRWRGRTETHVLTSGLDDYPRPQPPHPGELHVDLLAWVGLMAKVLRNAADVLGLPADETRALDAAQAAIARNLDALHWSADAGCFCDATVDDYEEHQLVCHRGYVSLFPLLVGLLAADDPKVGRLLALMGDADELFTPHGLRSLSKQDPLYGTAENYWRSPVWININYLAIVQLHNIASQDGPFQTQARDLYHRLRRNVVETVYQSWVETGFAWEQYNPETGAGQRTQHFTGWTSLVVKIMAMPELAAGRGGQGHHAKDEL
ncbi:glycoside hydrolase, family 63 [Niveomyces insectorum RCEF 264]|uniref:Mannosyl-oligosaccharide glucosidase n=1 Tax=Niveomyces insectorum RCEF 264 TaxID=1081102 RepID=A0A167U4T8_9HYPO|nr:glycoside hydrolase, family 63 [Niveomyces insectorum RCEF 264]